MGRPALIGGRGFERLEPWVTDAKPTVSVEGGGVDLLDAGTHLILARHGIAGYTPAHLVDHPRNLRALQDADCDRVLAICSVGSLHTELGVGSFLCPSDFLAFGRADAAFDDERGHVIPAFDPVWRRLVLEAWEVAAEEPMVPEGLYWQSPGPRFETPAEVRVIAEHADVVGMTMGSECAIANQLGLAYAAICVVDNLANGIGGQPLTTEEYEAGVAANRARLGAALAAILPSLASDGS